MLPVLDVDGTSVASYYLLVIQGSGDNTRTNPQKSTTAGTAYLARCSKVIRILGPTHPHGSLGFGRLPQLPQSSERDVHGSASTQKLVPSFGPGDRSSAVLLQEDVDRAARL